MDLKWYGHSCFVITTSSGTRIATDPYDPEIGYPARSISADVVTISHDHYDHNALAMVRDYSTVLREAGTHTIGDVRITGIPSFHDDKQGSLRGANLVFVIEADGMRVGHMGDLGALPDEATLALIGSLDILLAPVGGVYTIGPRLACDLANAVHARVFIPMHYQTTVLKLKQQLHPVDDLIAAARGCKVHRLNQSECSITGENLGVDRLLILDYDRE